MNLEQARSTLRVRAIEMADGEGVLLPQAVRERCSVEAGPQPDWDGGSAMLGPEEQDFLARRAARVEAELLRRHPTLHALGAAPDLGTWPQWLAALLVLAIGFASALGWQRQPMQLLGFPLLWLITWNLLVYLWLLVQAVAGAGAVPRPLLDFLARALARWRMPRWPGVGTGEAAAAVASRAAARFLQDWTPLQVPLLASRAQALLHAGAALLTLGTMIGLVLLGLRVHYVAGWESSWGVTADGLYALLRAVLAPAEWVTPVSVAAMPTLEDIRAWSLNDGGRGGPAWDLVKLFVVAAFLYVVLPRAALWGLARRRLSRWRDAFYQPPAGDPYFRRLLQAGRGTGEVAAVFCHALEPTAALRARIREALDEELGGRVALEFMPPVAYGNEAAATDALAGHDEREHVVAVFSLAATPEEEVQGELLRRLASHVAGRDGAAVRVVLDPAALARFDSGGGFRAHYDDRLRAWERFAKARGAVLRVLPAGEGLP